VLVASKEDLMGTLILGAIAVPALVVALIQIRHLRYIAWLTLRIGTPSVRLLTPARTDRRPANTFGGTSKKIRPMSSLWAR
jgi:hypothetical protein